MHPSHCPTQPLPRSGAALSLGSGRLRFGAALCGLLLFGACTSPGMKLNVKPGSRETTTQVDGLSVTLRPLSAEALKPLRARTVDPTAAELLVAAEKLPPYRLGPQDVLLVTVWDHPEITLPLGQYRQDSASGSVVDEDGQLYFPYVGKVKVAGMTVSQVRDALTAKLSRTLQNPQIDVKVIAYRSQKIYVGGEVKSPAVYTVTDVPFTLAEAVNRAGGFLPTADDSRVVLTRGDQVWRLNFQSLVASGNRIGQILLKDGDSLHVPHALENPVYMMGELVRPGNLPLIHGNLSLAQAITETGGILGASADARSIYVIRQTGSPNGVDVFHLDARNPTSMVLADRFPLNPRDIVYVDAGTLVRFNRVMSLLLPTVTAVTSTAIATGEVRYLVRRER
ncbi:polysaccharide biosynthesis/export family protein [Geothrix sp. 21YS21S-4]|uniref:polysaccharide biosynthesis/export family protein n=1 Tax=Geothrix sp. 21YS21S-4 TaxID=3068889 RepID=UPI0027B91CF2|nr:polysaccharide biosynthesis/export family protein [Geothrix sp. 21YS21S-4]